MAGSEKLTAFDASSACLNASGVEMSGFGAPALMPTAKIDLPKVASEPGALLTPTVLKTLISAADAILACVNRNTAIAAMRPKVLPMTFLPGCYCGYYMPKLRYIKSGSAREER